MKLYKDSFNIAFPIKTIHNITKYQKHLPWITKGLVQSSVTKHNLYRTKLQQPTHNNIDNYKKYTTCIYKNYSVSPNKLF